MHTSTTSTVCASYLLEEAANSLYQRIRVCEWLRRSHTSTSTAGYSRGNGCASHSESPIWGAVRVAADPRAVAVAGALLVIIIGDILPWIVVKDPIS
jgi:hypothetical protein